MTDQEFLEDATTALFTYWDQAVRPLGLEGQPWHEVAGEMRTAHLAAVRSFLLWVGEHYCPLLYGPRPTVRTGERPPSARRGRSREEEAMVRGRWEAEARELLAERAYSHRHLQRVLAERTGVNPSLTVVSGLITRCSPHPEQIGA